MMVIGSAAWAVVAVVALPPDPPPTPHPASMPRAKKHASSCKNTFLFLIFMTFGFNLIPSCKILFIRFFEP
jgi:hypothetical protein